MNTTKDQDRAIQYLKNAGGEIATSKFDEDFEPIGPQIRASFRDSWLVYQGDGLIGISPEYGEGTRGEVRA